VARFSALGEEFRRRLRLSGINVSVVSRGASGFEVVVSKDELEKLTPEEKEAIKQYLEHVAQAGDEEKRKAAIKTALEKKLREILGEEYEQWRDHVKITEGGRRLVITLQRLAQNPNTVKQNEKT
jgi:predicted DNA-binding transcriptional regulator YafY